MFTGIIEKTGKIKKIEKKEGKIYFSIEAKNFLKGVKKGDSISCDGACLTIVKKIKNNLKVELMPETLKLTKFGDSQKKDLINLELATKIGERLGGHFVTGHIDAVGVIFKIIQESGYTDLIIKVPQKLMKYLAYKGSVSVNGVSLTIAGRGKDWFKVCLITHTLKVTNFSELKVKDKVNIEIDIIARYLETLLGSK